MPLTLGAAGVGGYASPTTPRTGSAGVDQARYPFEGAHQAGITTPAQDRLHFAAFDVTTDSRAELVALLKKWTDAARQMTAGNAVGGAVPTAYDAPPSDTGEALGLDAAGLTLTFGFGPSLFEQDGRDRFGIGDRRPAALRELPHFPADNLDPGRSNGDLCVQACAHDPQVAVHAIRNLARIGFGTVAMRWAQLGFGRTSSTSTQQATPRNLLGFKDGTANLKAEDAGNIEKFVWVDDGRRRRAPTGSPAAPTSSPAGSTCTSSPGTAPACASRRRLIGRNREEGAPLSGGTEFTEPDFDVQGRDGPLIAVDSHVRLAHREHEQGRAAAAPRLQLHRRQQRARPPRRRAVLHRVRARPRRALHPDADPAVLPGRADGVPPAHRLGPVRRTARRTTKDGWIGEGLFA